MGLRPRVGTGVTPVLVHTLNLWLVVATIPGFDLSEHLFCVGGECIPYEEICEFDHSRYDVVCPHTFEAPGIASQEWCTKDVRYAARRGWFEWRVVEAPLTLCINVTQFPAPP